MFRKLFDPEAKIWQVMSRVGDLILLNWIFIITSLPIFTAGPSLTALSYVQFRMMDGMDEHPIRDYFEAWKGNFKRSFIIWIVYLALILICLLNISILIGIENPSKKVLLVVHGFIMAIATITLVYSLALQARFENSFTDTIVKGFIVAIAGWKATLVIGLILFASMAITFESTRMIFLCFPFWFLIGASGLAYICNRMIYSVFARVTSAKDKEKIKEGMDDSV
jgi:uncharacterized membrane protein YesL